MPVTSPVTTSTFGNMSLVVLTVKPTNLAAISLSEITAGENISCHAVGDWWPTDTVEKVARQRKMCQTSVPQANGAVTTETPALTNTYVPQEIDTPGAPGNEAYEALEPGTDVYLAQRIGKAGKSDWGTGDAYRLFPVNIATRTPGASAEDAGAEAIFTSELAFADGYTEPIDGVIAA